MSDGVSSNGARGGTGAAIASVGAAVPDGVLATEELANRLGVPTDWILTRTGVSERRIASNGESTAGLAARAAEDALGRAALSPEQIDSVLVATMTPDEQTPNVAPIVAHELGVGPVCAADVGMACTGFLAGLSFGVAQIESGRAERVLVIGSEIMSRLTNFDDRGTAALFADGAGAVVLERAQGEERVGTILLRSDGSLRHLIRADRNGGSIEMLGQDTYRFAVDSLAEVARESVREAGVGFDRVDLFLCHQANARIVSAVAERLEIPPERVASYIDRYGNTSAASIPIALAAAERDGRLRSGSTILMVACGSGFTWGAAMLKWRGTG
jgi:3-oxoacyl-[acyl-carrier-protein] synthase-3